jgi:uncharacterized protein YcaQ
MRRGGGWWEFKNSGNELEDLLETKELIRNLVKKRTQNELVFDAKMSQFERKVDGTGST